MLGHKVVDVLGRRCDVWATLRSSAAIPRLAPERVVSRIDAADLRSVDSAVETVRPDVLINCVGIVKQVAAPKSAIPSIEVNALFPHRLAQLAEARGARVIQISTDCVFSGRRGNYSEQDLPDPVDLYGRTKLLGELESPHTLTIRTSIVGRELSDAHGLLEWFLAQSGVVRGFRRAVFSGLTTEALAKTLAAIIAEHRDLTGVWHVASEPIDKYTLLRRFADVYEHRVDIEPDDSVEIDRSLDDTRFRSATGIAQPTWDEMLDALARDPVPYGDPRAVAC